ncbi:sensor histidine kinase [Nonomuraea gerenzanensis]|uniref:histidine kinase n=1 Tax=Nonomuraea gerenzanensis TaxID=93944 RepID=A0A1M4EDK3_9ACTN|nr:HAMP domain-containing sensor histidine kinase [Nonomuraea gerenzanensis]UBU08507.1 HAMP domain-containing histidine kinase [Nonomuraea gerenzanensis]SBO96854.1 probable two-component sensor kinase [Nonomuraea gerenzanensis]
MRHTGGRLLQDAGRWRTRTSFEWSIRGRVTTLATMVTVVLCVITGWLVLNHRLNHELDHRLRHLYGADLELMHLFAHRTVPPVIQAERVTATQLVTPSGRVVSASALVRGQPRMATFAPPRRPSFADRRLCDVPGFPGRCMLVAAMWVPTQGGDLIAYSTLPEPPWYGSGPLLAQLVVASGFLLAVVAFGSYHLVGRTLRPVEAMTVELAEITATDLGHRVPVPAHHDEIRYLATVVNNTLDLLEKALQRERRFTSEASHDLRTPITGARLRLEEALMNPGAVDWPDMAKDLLNDVERQQAIADDILTLARLDADRSRQHVRTDLAELVRAELQRRLPGRVPVRADLQPEVYAACDRVLLARLLTNLVDNAQRHAATCVTVAVRAEHGDAVLAVMDDGAGIARQHREIVFERFARLPESRERDPKGTGLGLAICREIARTHRGTLTVEDPPGQGTCLVLRMPLLT